MNVAESTKEFVSADKRSWVVRFARVGLAAKGIVYCLLGILSAMAAFGLGGAKSDKQGAVNFIYEQPFGEVLLVLVGIGLACYAAWRFIQAINNTEDQDSDAKGIFTRVRYAFSALIYAAFALFALRTAFMGEGKSGNNRQFLVEKVLELPFGNLLIGLAALGFIGAGIYQVYKAFSNKFKKDVSYKHLSNTQENMLNRAGKIGYSARGIVWFILGYFLLRAAMHNNASEAQGTKQVFDFLQNTGGSILMGLVSLGLVAYGIFMFVRARYQQVHSR